MALPSERDVERILPQVLAELGGQARPRDVYPVVTSRFPVLTPGDLTETLKDGRTNKWTYLIQWARQSLVEDRSIASSASSPGAWALTEKGWRRARGEEIGPVQRRRSSPGRRAAAVRVEHDVEQSKKPSLRAGSSGIEATVARLRTTQTASPSPDEFEDAVVAAFKFLGFDAERVGGAGESDVVADATTGIGRYSLVIDCRTTSKDRSAEAGINFVAIDEHRKYRNADYALVIGPDFAQDNLTATAASLQIGLLRTEHLIEVLRLHSETPLSLDELKALFERGSLIDSAAVNELKAVGHQLARRWLLLRVLVEQVATWAQLAPDKVMATPASFFGALLLSRDDRLRSLTREEIEDALSVLSSASVGILRRVGNGVDGYCLTTSVAGARQRLARLGAAQLVT
jgi:Mrr N-terminal domain